MFRASDVSLNYRIIMCCVLHAWVAVMAHLRSFLRSTPDTLWDWFTLKGFLNILERSKMPASNGQQVLQLADAPASSGHGDVAPLSVRI